MSKKKVWVVVGLVVTSGLAVLLFVLQATGGKPRAKSAARAPEPVEESERVPSVGWPVEQRVPAGSAGRALEASPAPQEREVIAEPSEQQPAGTQDDKTPELHAALEGEYALDKAPTAEALRKERVIQGLFAPLGKLGRLEELGCKESVCRGVVRIATESADSEVFQRTALSSEFATGVRDAISVTSREKLGDGSVRATFFTHPQEMFGLVATAPSQSEER